MISDTKLPGDPKNRSRFLGTRQLTPGPTRKLFQPAHQRFYLVAVGLHCDVPGFPRVAPAHVREAGFVVRRHRVVLPEGSRPPRPRCCASSPRPGPWPGRGRPTRTPASSGAGCTRSARADGAVTADAVAAVRRLEVLKRVETARRKLQVWADQAGVERRTEGWVPTGEGRFGAWVPIEETPAELVERSYPLRLLTAAPGDPDHAGALGTVYWGMVPTAGDEVAADASTRFAVAFDYEIRAWAREECGDCPGPLVWSEPSESYGVASFHDPAGCAQRPIEITLPDLRELEGSTASPSVRVSSPPGSGLSVPHTTELPEEGSGSVNEKEQICFFSISLFTIVAFFLFNLFLPILLFAFGLWWMLKLKFCLPPSIELEGELSTELEVVPGGISASAGIDVDLFPGIDQDAITLSLQMGLDGLLAPDPPEPPELPETPGGLPPGMNLGTTLTEQLHQRPDPRAARRAGLRRTGRAGAELRPAAHVHRAGHAGSGDPPMTVTPFTGPTTTPSAASARPVIDRLGTGVDLPLSPDPVRGALGYRSGPEKVQQSILVILLTEPGERVMRPDFGCGLRRFLMEPNTVAVRASIQREVSRGDRRVGTPRGAARGHRRHPATTRRSPSSPSATSTAGTPTAGPSSRPSGWGGSDAAADAPSSTTARTRSCATS